MEKIIKFKDYQYIRPKMALIEEKFNHTLSLLEKATSVEEQINAINEINGVRADFETMRTLSSIRHSINTFDLFYEQENDFFDENSPLYAKFENKLVLALYNSPFRHELESVYGKHLFNLIEVNLKTFKPEIIPDLQIENKLVTQYDKLKASAKIEFDGNTYNLAQMSPFLQSTNRKIRKRAESSVSGFYEKNEAIFDDIYDQLVKVRTKIAKTLGFSNFVELGYARLGRIDYNHEMVANYRKQVYEDLVPIVKDIIKAKAKRLGLRDLKSYDLGLNFLSGNPTPKGGKEWMVDNASKMYLEMSKETRLFFDYMTSRELLDLDAKPGKHSGGYCTYLPNYQSPFIFANFNGTASDVDVLTHEAGHAFQVFSSRHFTVLEYLFPTLEACEIHSMSMEFFAWPWMELFFEHDTMKYYYSHLADSLTFIPYGVSVDEFQHEIYQNPDMTKDERKALWRKIEQKYTPYKVYELDFLNRGGFWFRQGHIFQTPFYYIDYTLAQVCAHQFWVKNQENPIDAWQDYYRLCQTGGSMSFLELLKVANLKNPFVDGTIKAFVPSLQKWLKANENDERLK